MRITRPSIAIIAGAFSLAASCLAPLPTEAATTYLWGFTGYFGAGDGANPEGGVIADASGTLYGTTSNGGAYHVGSGTNGGTVFKLTAPATGQTQWSETILHSFAPGTQDGSYPRTGLLRDGGGRLYGTTSGGGSGASGTLYRLDPPNAPGATWKETILHSFAGGSGGAMPGEPIFGPSGSLYGMTFTGGSNAAPYYSGCGLVFQLKPPSLPGGAWTESVLYAFACGADGIYPMGRLVADAAGALYGVTYFGGKSSQSSSGFGVVFKLAPPSAGKPQWSYAVIHTFAGGSDGSLPRGGLIIDKTGAIYGTTSQGGVKGSGTVFKLTPPAAAKTAWIRTTIYGFAASGDGAQPSGPLVADAAGALYGATNNGGLGTVFKLTPPPVSQTQWRETILAALPYPDSANGSLLLGAGNAVFGTSIYGGHAGSGTVFKITQ